MLRAVLLGALAACGGGSASLPANRAIETTSTTNITTCTRLARATEPLTKSELELRATPGDVETVRARLLGVWDGHAYETHGELGQPGVTPEPRDPQLACFEHSGELTYVQTNPDPTCKPRTRTYVLERDDEGGGEIVLRVATSGGCPGDAGYETPYRQPYYISRLDDRFLVLVDGVTAAVTAYRRR